VTDETERRGRAWATGADVRGDALSERLQNQDADDELGGLAKVLDTFFRHEQAFPQFLWRVAAVLAINRLCAPGSEPAVEERWYPSTTRMICWVSKKARSTTRGCTGAWIGFCRQPPVEQHLKQRYRKLFVA
jgi:hypothetical protein